MASAMARSSDRDGRPSHARGSRSPSRPRASIPVLPGGRGHATGNEAVDVLRFPEVIARRCMKCISGAWVAASYFEIVIGIPTFSILPMVVWNKMLRIRKVVRSQTVSFTE